MQWLREEKSERYHRILMDHILHNVLARVKSWILNEMNEEDEEMEATMAGSLRLDLPHHCQRIVSGYVAPELPSPRIDIATAGYYRPSRGYGISG